MGFSTSCTMGRMHSDAQFAGFSSVPAHVEMMGFLETDNTSTIRYTIILLFLPTLNSKLLDTVFFMYIRKQIIYLKKL